ncbi:MAG TPA: uridine phosphorylase [Aquifex aeolicus]|uniref:Uridine phosphorylase n=1 Tax=Aquifex aeolicus TaxID=63363 RepID=A0A7C5L8F8_AQUAO|nr:uridine phosphorylase [Aquifex aeolicus]
MADLPVIDGRVYHLSLRPGELAEDILIVGDPRRADFIKDSFLKDVELRREHRGLVTVTGYTEWGQRVSVTTSGMGTPSLEIVINEVVALHEIDFGTMKRRENPPVLNVIRVGTSGGLQRDTELGTPVVTAYAVGLDNTGLFYDVPYPDGTCALLEEKVREKIEELVKRSSRFKGRIHPYASKAHPEVVKALVASAEELGVKVRVGVTVSNSGFFANQGRVLFRIPPTVPDIDLHLADVDTGTGLRIENMEMEASFLLHFLHPLGHRGGVICPVIDRRPTEEFLYNYQDAVRRSAEIALRALGRLRGWI